MIHVLVTGIAYNWPDSRMAKNGKPYTCLKLKADDGAGGTVWCSLIAFNEVAEALAVARKDSALSVTGRLTPTAWLDRDGSPRAGLNVTVEGILHLKKPKPAAPPAPPPDPPPDLADDGRPDFDDDLPVNFH
ncbi:MAG: hypothetical protein RKO66_14290 [Candidatus Contendobacter sp.]|nr:hypothetical protein [Candidatus Contendobacter sp.]